jgi:hypothetical protein
MGNMSGSGEECVRTGFVADSVSVVFKHVVCEGKVVLDEPPLLDIDVDDEEDEEVEEGGERLR